MSVTECPFFLSIGLSTKSGYGAWDTTISVLLPFVRYKWFLCYVNKEVRDNQKKKTHLLYVACRYILHSKRLGVFQSDLDVVYYENENVCKCRGAYSAFTVERRRAEHGKKKWKIMARFPFANRPKAHLSNKNL